MAKRSYRALLLFLSFLFIFSAFPVFSHSADAAAISNKKLTLTVGDTYQLSITGTTEKVKWSSSYPKAASVTKKGVVTAKLPGKVSIYAVVGSTVYKCKLTILRTDKMVYSTFLSKGTYKESYGYRKIVSFNFIDINKDGTKELVCGVEKSCNGVISYYNTILTAKNGKLLCYGSISCMDKSSLNKVLYLPTKNAFVRHYKTAKVSSSDNSGTSHQEEYITAYKLAAASDGEDLKLVKDLQLVRSWFWTPNSSTATISRTVTKNNHKTEIFQTEYKKYYRKYYTSASVLKLYANNEANVTKILNKYFKE